MAFPACSPPLVSVRAFTPSRSEELPLGRRYHPTTSCSVPVVSHHLDGLPRTAAASLLHPAASLEVRLVSRGLQRSAPESALAVCLVPRDAVHTLQRVSLISSRTASLRPLPSYRWSPTSSLHPTASPSEEGLACRHLRRDDCRLELNACRSSRFNLVPPKSHSIRAFPRPKPARVPSRFTEAIRARRKFVARAL